MSGANGKTNDMELLTIRTAQVQIGELELVLRTGNLVQHKALMETAKKLEPSLVTLLTQVAPLFTAARNSEIITTVLENGPKIFATVIDILGGEAVDVAAEIAGVLLDNERNFNLVYPAQTDTAAPTPERSGSRYLRSTELRAHVAAEITIPQLLNLLQQAADVNGYGALGKALRRLLTTAPESGEGVTPQEPEINNVEPDLVQA